jgi:hypothetical protein
MVLGAGFVAPITAGLVAPVTGADLLASALDVAGDVFTVAVE